jgi:ribosomal protein S18 acetylase RimI-like enzyme
MNIKVEQRNLNQKEIKDFLLICDSFFIPPLSTRVNIDEYALKLSQHAVNFASVIDSKIIGIFSVYFNNLESKEAFISNVCVHPDYRGVGIAKLLLNLVVDYGKKMQFNTVKLEVNKENNPAVSFYKKHKFTITGEQNNSYFMSLSL